MPPWLILHVDNDTLDSFRVDLYSFTMYWLVLELRLFKPFKVVLVYVIIRKDIDIQGCLYINESSGHYSAFLYIFSYLAELYLK